MYVGTRFLFVFVFPIILHVANLNGSHVTDKYSKWPAGFAHCDLNSLYGVHPKLTAPVHTGIWRTWNARRVRTRMKGMQNAVGRRRPLYLFFLAKQLQAHRFVFAVSRNFRIYYRSCLNYPGKLVWTNTNTAMKFVSVFIALLAYANVASGKTASADPKECEGG